MIRLFITQNDTRLPGPEALLVAYRVGDPIDEDDPRIPAFLRVTTRAPDAITRAAPHVEPDDLTDEADDGDAGLPEPRQDDPADAAHDNTLAGAVRLSVEHALPGFDGLPFAYEFVQPGRASTAAGRAEVPDPVLRIVAAPGVHVQLLRPFSGQPTMRVDVIRVADPNVVPALGDTLDASLLLAGNDVGMHRYSFGMTGLLYATMHAARFIPQSDEGTARAEAETERVLRYAREPDRIAVMRQRDGMLFFDNRAERMLQVTVPRFSGMGSSGPSDAEARFGYAINPQAGVDEVAVTVAATAGVRVVQFHYGSFEAGISVAPDITQAQLSMQPFALTRVPNFADVPWPGAPITPPMRPTLRPEVRTTMRAPSESLAPWREVPIPLIEPPPSLADMAAHIAIDMAVSRLEPVGDALDVLELGWALATGRDRWGQPVGWTDLTMMALGAALPFVGRRDLQVGLFVSQATLGCVSVSAALGELDGAEELDAP
jgi:hypothetical protein